MIDVDKIRNDTPSCEHLIHFNNAGASLMPEPVYQSVTDHLALEQRMGGYEAHAAAMDKVADFYTQFAALLNAKNINSRIGIRIQLPGTTATGETSISAH